MGLKIFFNPFLFDILAPYKLVAKRMKKTNKNLDDIARGKISAIFEKLVEDGSIFQSDFSKIAKLLLKEFLTVDPFKVEFSELVKAYLENIEFYKSNELDELEDDIVKEIEQKRKEEILQSTSNEDDFYRFICKKYFNLIKEPKEQLLLNYEKAVNDLKEVDNTLNKIKTKLNEITNKNNPTEIQKEKPILYYYQEHNEKAKTSILSFIKNGIKDYSLRSSYDSDTWASIPYAFRWNPKSYQPHYPSDIENKFYDLPFPDFLKLQKSHKNNRPEFDKFAADYIKEKEIIPHIQELCDEHHILNGKKDVLIETLQMYLNGSKIMFATAVPSIIEGIFYELCILTGENENELLRDGFQQKLDKLHPKLGIDLFYEYYSFSFRLFRNTVSHGRLKKVEVDNLADLLLLDLYQVCKLVKTDKIDYNHKRFVIHELSQNMDNPDYRYLLKFISLNEIQLDSFYNLDNTINQIELLLKKEEFWEFVEKEIAQGGESAKNGLYVLMQKINNKDLKNHRTKILKTLQVKDLDHIQAENYLKYLTKDIF